LIVFRYGDALNPWGDLITMARSWCLAKRGGFAVVGMPVGEGIIGFNSHRVYGPHALAQLFANWEQIYSEVDFKKYNRGGCYFCYQPAFTLRKKD